MMELSNDLFNQKIWNKKESNMILSKNETIDDIENNLIDIFPTIKKDITGVLELNIYSYTVRILPNEYGNNVIVFKHGKNINLPNLINSEDRLEALYYFVSVINIIFDKAALEERKEKISIGVTGKKMRIARDKREGIPMISFDKNIPIQIKNEERINFEH